MRIGFIGLGNVGAKLSGSLVRSGHDVTVRDLDPEVAEPLLVAGASWGESAADMARDNDLVITCLPSPVVSAAVLEGADGVLAGLTPDTIWLEMSTTDEDEVTRLGALVEAAGGHAVDCPVSGGCHKASTGNIAIFAGCERETFERILPVLSLMGREIVHTGRLGSASVLKVITNYLAGVQLISTGEAFMVAKKSGLDLNVAYEAIRVSSGNSFVHETEGQLILNGSYNINFTLDHEVKDLALFDELGARLDVPLELSPVAVDIMRDGLERFGPRAWSSTVVKRLEDDCGEDLRGVGFPDYLVDREPPTHGHEVVVDGRDDLTA